MGREGRRWSGRDGGEGGWEMGWEGQWRVMARVGREDSWIGDGVGRTVARDGQSWDEGDGGGRKWYESGSW